MRGTRYDGMLIPQEGKMTTISASGRTAADMIASRSVKIDKRNEVHEFKQGPVSEEVKADYEQKKANAARVVAEAGQPAPDLSVHGRHGDQQISSLNAYTAALKDYISKQAATAYRQMQDS
jgi:hypothetical protein